MDRFDVRVQVGPTTVLLDIEMGVEMEMGLTRINRKRISIKGKSCITTMICLMRKTRSGKSRN